VLLSEHSTRRDAIGTGAAALRAGNVRSGDRYWEAGVQAQDAGHFPSTDDAVKDFVHVLAERLTPAKRQSVYDVRDGVMSGIVVTRSPLRCGVVDVLVVVITLSGLSSLPVVTKVVGHALRVSIGRGKE